VTDLLRTVQRDLVQQDVNSTSGFVVRTSKTGHTTRLKLFASETSARSQSKADATRVGLRGRCSKSGRGAPYIDGHRTRSRTRLSLIKMYNNTDRSYAGMVGERVLRLRKARSLVDPSETGKVGPQTRVKPIIKPWNSPLQPHRYRECGHPCPISVYSRLNRNTRPMVFHKRINYCQ
jgi:hypothetical protein